MPLLFEVHDAERFGREVLPALVESRRRRSFEPCRELCAALLPAVRESCGSDWEIQVVSRVVAGLDFASEFWRGLVDEVLLFAAVEVPPVADARETLCRLLQSCGDSRDTGHAKPQALLIEHSYQGSRDLVVGPVCYRPLAVGVNDPKDVARLAHLLAAVNPDSWDPGLLDADELDYARQALVDLQSLYGRAAAEGRLIVCEAW